MYIALDCACRFLLPVLTHPEQSEAGAKHSPRVWDLGWGSTASLTSRSPAPVTPQSPAREGELPPGVTHGATQDVRAGVSACLPLSTGCVVHAQHVLLVAAAVVARVLSGKGNCELN